MLTYKNRQIPETFEEVIDPEHTALIIHEMLNDFCREDGAFAKTIPDNALVKNLPELIEPTVNLLHEARTAGVKVLYVRWTNLPDDGSRSDPEIRDHFDEVKDGTYVMQNCLLENTWGHQIIDELKPLPDEMVLNKYKFDAFLGANLETILQWNRIKTIIIVGQGVQLGIMSTASTGWNKGYFVVIPEDCMIYRELEWKEPTMKFFNMWGIVRPSTDLIAAWKARQ